MKTTLFITTFLITAISFAQLSKRPIKIGGTEKPYARIADHNNSVNTNAYRYYQNRKFNETLLSSKSTNKKRRVIVTKSNKQGDPN